MAVRTKNITVGCADPYRLAQFWLQLTGFSEDPDNGNAPDDPEGNEFPMERSDADRAPLVEQLGRAFDAVAGLISNIRADQWSAPTPCTDSTVRQIVNHVIGMDRVFAALLAGQPPPPRPSADPSKTTRSAPTATPRPRCRQRSAGLRPRADLPRPAWDRHRCRATADPALRPPRPWLGPRAGHGAARRPA